MTNKDYILKQLGEDTETLVEILASDCELCMSFGIEEYCKSEQTRYHTCKSTIESWLSMEHDFKPIKLDIGEIVEVKLPTDTQLCYYAGNELGVYYFTNSKKTCEQIKELGLKQINKADLIVLLGCDLPLCISKVGD